MVAVVHAVAVRAGVVVVGFDYYFAKAKMEPPSLPLMMVHTRFVVVGALQQKVAVVAKITKEHMLKTIVVGALVVQ